MGLLDKAKKLAEQAKEKAEQVKEKADEALAEVKARQDTTFSQPSAGGAGRCRPARTAAPIRRCCPSARMRSWSAMRSVRRGLRAWKASTAATRGPSLRSGKGTSGREVALKRL